jgi:hypothetical protein
MELPRRIMTHMNQKTTEKAYIARFEDLGQGLAEGPDPEELILALETRFGIIIAGDEAEAIRTPAQLVDLIMTKVESLESNECLSQRAFHLIRRAAMRSFHRQRQAVSPGSKLDDIVPRKLRYARWKYFGTNVGASRWPELKRSRTTFAILALLAGTGFAFSSATLPVTGLPNFLASSAITIAFAFALAWITRPLKRSFPVTCLTVRDLVDWIVAENPQLIRNESKDWTRERVSAVVRRLIVEWSNERDFTEESLFYPTRMIT